ncbi:glycosyltransferase family 4 protein [Priestia megaterium]
MVYIKVLIIHNYYKHSGGEDKVVEEEIRLLEQNKINVIKYFISNDEIKMDGVINKLILGINTIYSKKQYNSLKAILLKERPDVVHVHNTFPLISPSVYYLCSELGVPVVQTLHNYRLGCAGAMLLRDGQVCEKCIQGSLINGIKHGCYRDSRIQTVPLSTMLYTHRFLNTWNKKVNKYIALTSFAKKKFQEIGLDEKKIAVKPNFIKSQHISNYTKENQIVFVGRISKEKGLHLLLEAWKGLSPQFKTKLNIIGDGPLKEELASKYEKYKNINFLGKLDSNEVLGHMAKSKYIVVPSVWYEGFPMTIIEAYSVNTPVISSNIGSLKEVVKEEVTGFHFENNNVADLKYVLEKALKYKEYEDLQENIKVHFNNNYTSDINFKILMNIYKEVIGSGKSEK